MPPRTAVTSLRDRRTEAGFHPGLRIGVLEKENRMLRSMLPDAIDITDAALADDGERKEKLTPELPLFRPLQERGTLGLISTGHLPSSPADRRRCRKAESPPRWAGPQGHAALKGMTLLFATWCLSAARGHGAPPSFGRLPVLISHEWRGSSNFSQFRKLGFAPILVSVNPVAKPNFTLTSWLVRRQPARAEQRASAARVALRCADTSAVSETFGRPCVRPGQRQRVGRPSRLE